MSAASRRTHVASRAKRITPEGVSPAGDGSVLARALPGAARDTSTTVTPPRDSLTTYPYKP